MFSVRIVQGGRNAVIKTDGKKSLLELLQENGFYIAAPCGGRGTCGKCLVKLERETSSETVLACRTEVTGDCTVTVPDAAEESDAGTAIAGGEERGDTPGFAVSPCRSGYGAAVDLGTTTIVTELYSLSDGTRAGTRSGWNRQAAYGADVISRIHYISSHEDGLEKLAVTVRVQITEMIRDICREAGIPETEVTELFLAGNTVMQHIFAGLSPVSIASAPFTPASLFDDGGFLDAGTWDAPACRPGMKVYLSPCVAGYVGGDITAGLLYTGAAEKKGRSLFIDVGTNGEMALGGADGFACCSVATGPAFEGAEISCGMTGTAGAVSRVAWEPDGYGGRLRMETIGGAAPAGICGSGLIDLLAVLLRLGVVDETGRMLPPEELEDDVPPSVLPHMGTDENGNGIFFLTADHSVYFTAGDVRKLQLAKAAVMAGIRVLLKEEQVSTGGIDTFYLAGGFGKHISPESAAAIGMFPAELTDRIVCPGNASLGGAAEALLDTELRDRLIRLRDSCRYLELSGNAAFTEEYMEQMMFGED